MPELKGSSNFAAEANHDGRFLYRIVLRVVTAGRTVVICRVLWFLTQNAFRVACFIAVFFLCAVRSRAEFDSAGLADLAKPLLSQGNARTPNALRDLAAGGPTVWVPGLTGFAAPVRKPAVRPPALALPVTPARSAPPQPLKGRRALRLE